MKKRKNRAFHLLCLLAAMVLALAGCRGGFSDEAVMKINGQEIMKSEYMVYLYTATQSFLSAAGEDVWSMDFDGKSADELVEERAIQTLQSVIAAKEYAAGNGIALTEEQKQEAKQAAEQFLANVSSADVQKMGVDTQKLIPMMEASYLYSLVYGTIASEREVDPADAEEYYQQNHEQIQWDYTAVQLQSILLEDAAKAQEAAERAKAGEDFKTLFAEYDTDPSVQSGQENGETTMYQSALRNLYGLTEALEAGNVTDPIQAGGRYYIFRAMGKTVPTEEQVREIAQSAYRNEVQTEYAEKRMEEMIAKQTMEKLGDAWETMEKFH